MKSLVPWGRVGSASALAAVGVGAALLMGVPQYNAMTIAENDYIRAATEAPQTLKPLSSRLSLKLNKQATWRDLFIGSGVVRWLRPGLVSMPFGPIGTHRWLQMKTAR